MQLRLLKLRNFRSFEAAETRLGPGLTVIFGDNGAGKTSLLEAAQYCLCGRSLRTTREEEMVMKGAGFMRLEAEVHGGGAMYSRAVRLGSGKAVNVYAGGGPAWLEPGSVMTFSPDDLPLVKGAPAGRRRFLDEAIARRRPGYRRLALDYQKIISQRNGFLKRARAGMVPLSDISPWDRLLAASALGIYFARRDYCRQLAPHFSSAWAGLAGKEAAVDLKYLSQLEQAAAAADPEREVLQMLRARWSLDMERSSTGAGAHRDEMEILLAGEPVRRFGSQGEQRLAVLALLLAVRSLVLEEAGPPPLLLDDVLSELDSMRRRRLMGILAAAGQALITAADRGLFLEEELAGVDVLEVAGGTVRGAQAGLKERCQVTNSDLQMKHPRRVPIA